MRHYVVGRRVLSGCLFAGSASLCLYMPVRTHPGRCFPRTRITLPAADRGHACFFDISCWTGALPTVVPIAAGITAACWCCCGTCDAAAGSVMARKHLELQSGTGRAAKKQKLQPGRQSQAAVWINPDGESAGRCLSCFIHTGALQSKFITEGCTGTMTGYSTEDFSIRSRRYGRI